MGADLYINSIYKRAYKKYEPRFDYWCRKRDEYSKAGDKENAERAQKKVDEFYDKMHSHDGYYRDSYNATNLLWQLGLSYWNGIGEYLDQDGNMQPEQIKIFLAQVLEREVPAPEDLKLDGATIDDGENSREKWHEFFVEKRKRLIAFLGNALDRNEPIDCSF